MLSGTVAVTRCDSSGFSPGPGATTPSDAAIELDPNIMDIENRLPATFDYREPMVNAQVPFHQIVVMPLY
jgi:hypothetical protein